VEQGNSTKRIIGLATDEANELPDEDAERVAALRAFLKFCEQYGQGTKALAVAYALAKKTLDRLISGKPAIFNSANIADLVGQKVSSDRATAWLSKVWKDLEQRLEERRTGFQDTARQASLSIYAWPKKSTGAGGAGNSSTYAMEFLKLPEEGEKPVSAPSCEISYVQELTLEPAFWAKPLLSTGFVLSGWRRTTFIGFGVAVIGAVGLALLWTLYAISGTWSSIQVGGVLLLLMFAAMVTWLGTSILRPFSQLLDRRIIMAPDALVAFRELNVQLEMSREKSETGEPFRLIRLVRYSGKCPTCGETVHVVDGGREFYGRLVGRCEEHPVEHVYSFDRYAKRGLSLR